MLKYTKEQLASLIALPIIVILLCWTVVIFHKNRRKWGPYDIPIVSVLVLSILRNLTILGYTLAIIFTYQEFNIEYCSLVTWLFNSIHTFQASSLTSIAVIGLFSAKLHRQSQNLRTFLTSTHIIYHLFCLTTLCACVGVAAILAQKETRFGNIFADSFDLSPCSFLPFELDIKFNVFIIVLHVFLAFISFISFLIICYNYYKTKKEGFDYIKKSNSDLSDLSNNFHGVNANVNDTRGFYDTYTINRSVNNNYCNKDTWTNSHFNNSEILSNNSTTVSSTNSRRPCIMKRQQDEEMEVQVRTTGLETMHPVLIVCYLFYHLPLIILCIHPRIINPWPVAGIALWLGLVQDLLIPIGLGIVDSRFCSWVTDVYRCSTKNTNDKLPQVGLDGKFRPFGLSSQPQSLDISQHERSKTLQQVEHRFPITNGSLYTSIDGRLPVIHNYRRHKEFRTGTIRQHQDIQSSNVALHSSHLSRRDLDSTPPQNYSNCTNCKVDQCPSHSNLHHLSPQYVHRKLSFLQASQNNVFSSNGERKVGENALQIAANHQNCLFVANKRLQNTQNSLKRNQMLMENSRQRNFPYAANKRLSQSQESINHLYYSVGNSRDSKIGDNVFYHRSEMNIASPSFNLNANLNNHMIKNSRNLVRLNKMRLSRSEESLTDLHIENTNEAPTNLQTQSPHSQTHPQHDHQNSYNHQYSSDEEEYCFNESNDHHAKDYDSMSSSNSITTEANCDFEFYQTKESLNSSLSDNSTRTRKISNSFFFEQSDHPQFNAVDSRQNVTSAGRKEKPKHVSTTRITRTNSRRSLENFQTYIEETPNPKEVEGARTQDNVSKVLILHRSNSYTTLEDKRKRKRVKKGLSRSNSKISDYNQFEINENDLNMKNKKNKSVEYLPNTDKAAIYINDLRNNNNGIKHVGNSVPDFKKVFISDYI